MASLGGLDHRPQRFGLAPRCLGLVEQLQRLLQFDRHILPGFDLLSRIPGPETPHIAPCEYRVLGRAILWEHDIGTPTVVAHMRHRDQKPPRDFHRGSEDLMTVPEKVRLDLHGPAFDGLGRKASRVDAGAHRLDDHAAGRQPFKGDRLPAGRFRRHSVLLRCLILARQHDVPALSRHSAARTGVRAAAVLGRMTIARHQFRIHTHFKATRKRHALQPDMQRNL